MTGDTKRDLLRCLCWVVRFYLQLLNAIQLFGANLDDYLHLLLPPIVKLFDAPDVPLQARKSVPHVCGCRMSVYPENAISVKPHSIINLYLYMNTLPFKGEVNSKMLYLHNNIFYAPPII